MLTRDNRVNYISKETKIGARNLNNIQDSILDNSEKIEDLNREVNSISSQLEQKSNIINIEQYKHLANGNDYSNAFKYIMDNIVDGINYTTIQLEQNKKYIINGEINKRYVSLIGNDSIIQGKITIGSEEIINKTMYYDTFMHVKIDGVHFLGTTNYAEWANTTDYGICIQNARMVEIKNCKFSQLRYAIRFLSRESFKTQHIARIKIVDCTFSVCGIVLYQDNYDLDDIPTEKLYELGDIEFNGNTCNNIKSDSIRIGNVDGFTCFNNIFFHDENKSILTINWSCGVFISNNKLFEPGTHGIKMNRGQDICITNNHIWGAGREDKSPAIDIYAKSLYGGSVVNIIISNNIFTNCSGHGISLLGDTNEPQGLNSAVVTGNIIGLLDKTYEPVKTNGYCTGVTIIGNVSNKPIRGQGGNPKEIILGNATPGIIDNYKNGHYETYWFNGESTTSISYNADCIIKDTWGGGSVELNIVSNIEFTDNTSLYIYSLYGNTKVACNDLIQTKSNATTTIGKGQIIHFIYIDKKFRQV